MTSNRGLKPLLPREMAEHFDGTEAQARAYERLYEHSLHVPVEEWVGFPMTICDRCITRWPCEYAKAHGA